MSNIISFDEQLSVTTSKFLDEICYVKVIMKAEDVAKNIVEISELE